MRETSTSEGGNCYQWILLVNPQCTEELGFFTCRKAGTWDRFFYFPSEGRHTEDFPDARKIQWLRPGLNPRTRVPVASMLTTRPPKPSTNCITLRHGSDSRPIHLATRSKAYACCRSFGGTAGFESRLGHGYLSPANILYCTRRGRCDGPIPHLEKSYRVWCVTECQQAQQCPSIATVSW